MRPRYLLDANIFIVSQRAERLGQLASAAGVVSCAVVDDVSDELTIAKRGKPLTDAMREAARILDEGRIHRIKILPNTPADVIRTELSKRVGKGEAASIAIAAQDLDLVFVSDDAKAVAGGPKLYRELPGEVGRIMGLHAFLRTLVERGALAKAVAREISTIAKLSSNLDPPLWWEAWEQPAPLGGGESTMNSEVPS